MVTRGPQGREGGDGSLLFDFGVRVVKGTGFSDTLVGPVHPRLAWLAPKVANGSFRVSLYLFSANMH